MSKRNSVGKREPFLKPFDVFEAEFFGPGKALHAAKSGANGHENDLFKVMLLIPSGAGIAEPEKGFRLRRQAAETL